MSINTATLASDFAADPIAETGPVAASRRGPALTACVACGSTEIHHWQTKRFQYTAESDREEFPIDRCGRCGTGFINPPPSLEWLKTIYQYSGHALTGPTDLDEVMARERRFPNSTLDAARMARQADRFNRSGNLTALDIGSGFGFYTRALRRVGYRTVSINPGDYENAVFKQLNGDEPLPVMLEDYRPDTGFGVVMLSQVLEHLLSPDQAVRKIASLLESGGVLACAVPNFNALTVRLLGTADNACLWVPEHVNYFTVAGLHTLLEENGFKVVAT
ncbi:MAG: class I SAM-dependent methyltransferase, partial [Methylococcaceae bacterium]|nr:class I SAM-dependent methyltransferase [Methylococcaceae bacterium]